MTLNVVSPGFPPSNLFWDATNIRLGINTIPSAVVHSLSTASAACYYAEKFSSDNAGPQFSYRKARGSAGALTGVQNNDVLFNIGGFGYDGTGWGNAASASIRGYADETFTTTAHGTRFTISTANIGSNTQTEKMRITANGSVNIGGATTSTSKLNIAGLPTSAAGLNAGDIWIDTTGGLNILKIV